MHLWKIDTINYCMPKTTERDWLLIEVFGFAFRFYGIHCLELEMVH